MINSTLFTLKIHISPYQHPFALVVFPNPSRPVVGQFQPFWQEQGPDTHDSTYLKNHEISLVDVVDQQKLNEVWDWKRKEKNAVYLRTVSDSEYLWGNSREDTQMTSITKVSQNYIDEVQLFDTADVVDWECQDAVENANAVVDGLKGVFMQKVAPKDPT